MGKNGGNEILKQYFIDFDKDSVEELLNTKPVPNRWQGFCFGCSKRNEIGLHLDFWWNDGKAYSKVKLGREYCGFEGVVHGGIVATLLDEISSWALGFDRTKMSFTLNAKIDYLKIVPVNQELYLVGDVLEKNGDISKVRSVVLNHEGNALAGCISTWKTPDLDLMSKLTKVPRDVLEPMVAKLVQPLKEYKQSLQS